MPKRAQLSLRRLLLIEFLAVAAILASLLYLAVRFVAGQAADKMQDNLLAASALTIAERLTSIDGEIVVDLPYSALDMLGVSGQERVFYRVHAADGETVTGYDDLPPATTKVVEGKPAFGSLVYRDAQVRVATVRNTVMDRRVPVPIDITVAQTRESLNKLSDHIALSALAVGFGFLMFAGVLGAFAVNRALLPLKRLAAAIEGRPPDELEPFEEEAPAEVQPLVNAINRFIGKLKSNLDVTERFIADAAHRIRTPLASVRIQAELAEKEAAGIGRAETFSRLVRSVDEVAQLTNQLLSNATVRYRSDRGERRCVDLFDLTHAAVKDLRLAAEHRGIAMVVVEEPGAELTTLGDELSLLEAVRNLLDNAVKYSPDGSRITVRLADAGAQGLRLSIEDQGPGVAASERERIFERFQRGGYHGNVLGSGLGLYIVRQVMHSHGGRVLVTDNHPAGAVLTLELPHRAKK